MTGDLRVAWQVLLTLVLASTELVNIILIIFFTDGKPERNNYKYGQAK